MSSERNLAFISGAAAGVASRMVTAPIDLLKIRLQMDTVAHPISDMKLSAILKVARNIYKVEGFTVSLCRSMDVYRKGVFRPFGKGILPGCGSMHLLVASNSGPLTDCNPKESIKV